MFPPSSYQIKQISDAQKAGAVPLPQISLFSSYNAQNNNPFTSHDQSMMFQHTSYAANPSNEYSDYDDDYDDDIYVPGNDYQIQTQSNNPSLKALSIGTKSLFSSYLQNSQQISNTPSTFGTSTGNGNYPPTSSFFSNIPALKSNLIPGLIQPHQVFKNNTSSIDQNQPQTTSLFTKNTNEDQVQSLFGDTSSHVQKYIPLKKIQNIGSSSIDKDEVNPKINIFSKVIPKEKISNIFNNEQSLSKSVPQELKSFNNYQNNVFQKAKQIKEVEVKTISEYSSSSSSNSWKSKGSSDEYKIPVKKLADKSQDLIKMQEKPISEQTVILPFIEISKNANESEETIKNAKKNIITSSKEEENELEMLRQKVKNLESLNQNYLKIIGDLSETVKNLSIGSLQKTQNQKEVKKIQNQKNQPKEKCFEKKTNIYEVKTNFSQKFSNIFQEQE